MKLATLREQVWEANLALPKNRLVLWTSGNASARDPETNLVVIKPSGVVFDDLTPENLVIVDLEGNVVDGDLKPSVDTASHLYVYRHRGDVNGIIHTHSPFATSFAIRGEPFRSIRQPQQPSSDKKFQCLILRRLARKKSDERSLAKLAPAQLFLCGVMGFLRLVRQSRVP